MRESVSVQRGWMSALMALEVASKKVIASATSTKPLRGWFSKTIQVSPLESSHHSFKTHIIASCRSVRSTRSGAHLTSTKEGRGSWLIYPFNKMLDLISKDFTIESAQPIASKGELLLNTNEFWWWYDEEKIRTKILNSRKLRHSTTYKKEKHNQYNCNHKGAY